MHLQSTAPSTAGTLTVSGNWSASARASLPLTMGSAGDHPGDPSHCTCGVERRAEFSALGSLAAVSWPWVPAWGSLEPSRRGGENAQKTRKNGEKMGEIWSKTCEHRKGQEGSTGSVFSEGAQSQDSQSSLLSCQLRLAETEHRLRRLADDVLQLSNRRGQRVPHDHGAD